MRRGLILCVVALLVLLAAAGCVVADTPAESGTPEPIQNQPPQDGDRPPSSSDGPPSNGDGPPADASQPAEEALPEAYRCAAPARYALPTPTGPLDEVIITRTPEPTATPGVIEQEVEELVAAVGLDQTTFLGLNATDWASLAISLLFVLAGFLIGTWLIRRVLLRVVRRTATEFDDRFLEKIGSDVRWLVVLITLHLATSRLTFVSASLKRLFRDAYVVVGLFLAVRIILKLIDLADEWGRQRSMEAGRGNELEPVMVLLSRVGRVVVVLLGLTALLSYFGVNVSGLATVLGLGGLAISLAARDTIADAIAGFIILVDQPFRIGDRIEIQGIGTWGDVVDIGLRTTRIRTRDNRMVIVPNSTISTNQVINYTFPDPQYRIQTHVGIDYDTDIDMARQVLIDAVRGVEGVLPGKPVDALYVEMGDSAMVFRVRWWIESYEDTRRMFDKVHTVLQHALDEAGIVCPFPTQKLNLEVEPQAIERIPRGQ
ncbi:mechanosensitive ion channel family protein [Chloroflexota bacterium]